MPSTAWNVFVASGVAIVVYFAVKMGQVLLGLAAGTILFLGGWLTGYAINEDLLDSMGLFRIGVAGAVSGFVVFWTVVVVEGEFLTGVLVIGLVWFAAWFTSEMGPIKGSTGAMATIDEPRPPEGPRPGTPVDLGGESTVDAGIDSGGGLLGGLRNLVTPSAPDPPDRGESSSPGPEGPPADELTDHSPKDPESDGEATDTTRKVDADETAGGQKESIFGLGIFYEGDPDGPTPAGVDTNEPNADSASTATEPRDGDHTRPAVSGGRPEKTDGGTTDGGTSDAAGSDDGPAIETSAPDEDESEADPEPSATEQASRLREPMNSPRRPGKAPKTESGYDLYRGSASEETNSGEATDSHQNGSGDAQSVDNDDKDDEPPEEHRVDVDDSGFIFG